jgi:hypothetical protein
VIVVGSRGQWRVAPQGEVKIMSTIRAARTTPREAISPRNGLPEHVPYVYRQQEHRNTYAARIARRNARGWWLPPVLPAGSSEMFWDGHGRRR